MRRTIRCSHGLAMGTCEEETCPGAATNIGSDRTPVIVSAPKCRVCQRECADAVHRGPIRKSGRKAAQLRVCDHCWKEKEEREEVTKRRSNYFDKRQMMYEPRREEASE